LLKWRGRSPVERAAATLPYLNGLRQAPWFLRFGVCHKRRYNN